MRSPARIIGWGLYGASAWTWCIGLYLPVLLLQWYGWPGFFIMAVPNIVGCTAMAVLLGRASTSRQFCERHGTLIRWFSVATIGFQLLFLSIAGQLLLANANELITNGLTIPLLCFAGAWLLAMTPTRLWPWLGAAAWLVSVQLLWHRFPNGFDGLQWTGERPAMDVLWFAPIFIFGFLLCPWLDAPFHRAVQETNSRWTALVLGLGFGVMLLVTASYWGLRENSLLSLVFAHLLVQSIFTMAANLRELSPAGVVGGRAGFMLILPLAAIALPWLGEQYSMTIWVGAQHSYLRYLALYGLIFPALVLFRCTPGASKLSIRRTSALVLLLVVAGVLADIGFIRGPAWLAAMAVALVMGVWLIRNARR
jgi:hypothetical protein